MTSKVGFSVKTPDIYYGQEKYPYAIVPNDLDVLGIGIDNDFYRITNIVKTLLTR
jgi:hypothetical protein